MHCRVLLSGSNLQETLASIRARFAQVLKIMFKDNKQYAKLWFHEIPAKQQQIYWK